ncbi:MAG TPA: NAD(P)/FAD-dependent oxidoreductase, partial [Tepidisphaeraceae bacterium]|nr:NAD(P)/FAD-dependent oxidoreductase [Tepidisphaeraceae bacterium]
QLATLYPEKYIYDVAGFPKVLAKDLAKSLSDQALQFNPIVRLGEQALKLDRPGQKQPFVIGTGKGTYHARSVIITGGIGAFTPKRLPISEPDSYLGRGLYYFVQDLRSLHGRRVLIVGGGDSAVDWANMLAPHAAEITLIHRRDQFRAHEDSVKKMRQSTVKIRTPYELKSVMGNSRIESAVIFDNKTRKEEQLEIEALLVNIGFESALGPIAEWGLELEGGQIIVDPMMQTSRAGIFAAGDIATFPGKLKLIATGFGEAAIAVNYAKHYLDPTANIFPGHSTALKGMGQAAVK